MLATQRQTEIVRDLQRVGVVSVQQLAKRFEVADETIRRDLAKLASSGRVVRTHGGALLPDTENTLPFAVRRVTNADAKRAIAACAAALVRPGDVVAVDASTTGLEVAKQIGSQPRRSGDPPVTVVSNGLEAVQWLAQREGVSVISTGGEFDASGACFVGSIAEATLRQFAFDHALISCQAFDAMRGPSESCPSHASIKRTMISLADRSTLLVDRSKIGRRSACYVAPLSGLSEVVAQRPLDADLGRALQDAGCRLIDVQGDP